MTDINPVWVLSIILVVCVGLYFIGTTLVDHYFNRKAKFVDDLYDKTKGNTNGKNE